MPPVTINGILAGQAVVKIAEKILTATAANIDFTNIPQQFKHLEFAMSAANDTGATNVLGQFSSDGTTFDTGSNYDYESVVINGTGVTASEALGVTSFLLASFNAVANVANGVRIFIPDYTNTAFQKTVQSAGVRKDGTSTGNIVHRQTYGFWRNTAALKGVRFSASANNFAIGSRISLYGYM